MVLFSIQAYALQNFSLNDCFDLASISWVSLTNPEIHIQRQKIIPDKIHSISLNAVTKLKGLRSLSACIMLVLMLLLFTIPSTALIFLISCNMVGPSCS